MIKEYCDRCGKVIEAPAPSPMKLMTKFEGEYPTTIGDLCKECGESFDAWWELKKVKTE